VKLLPSSLQALVAELSKLPGVGEKSALRYAVALLKSKQKRLLPLLQALESVGAELALCSNCHYWTENSQCPVCLDDDRNDGKLCVVRDSPDVLALEKFKRHPWKYHVLQGLLSPLAGVGPSQIRLDSLFNRVHEENFQEIILALDATVEGDATALFVRDQMKERAPGVRVTRTIMGLPAGSSVEYLDPSTLESALNHRMSFD